MLNEQPTIWELFAEDGWARVLISLKHGEPPLDVHLAAALRGAHEMPPKVRTYLADHFDGKIRKRRGAPTNVHARGKRAKRDYHVMMLFLRVIDEMRGKARCQRHGTPSEEAFEAVSERIQAQKIFISPAQVKAIVYPRAGIRGPRRSR